MDNLFRLFCGCCGIQTNDSDLPYRPLGNDDVVNVRDPPIPHPNSSANVHENGGYEQTDGQNSNTNSPTPVAQKSELEQEKEFLEGIVTTTQHNIIAVGQVEHIGLGGREIFEREKKYEMILKQHEIDLVKNQQILANGIEISIDFEFEPTQPPVELPTTYEEMVSSVPATIQERPPFSCPNMNKFTRARPTGRQFAKVLEEHPDAKKAGKIGAVPRVFRQKLKEFAQEVHNGVEACQIEHKTNLVVFMDL